MAIKTKEELEKLARTANAVLPGIDAVDRTVTMRVEDEITKVIDEVVRPYLLETIPHLMRKLNNQGVFDKLVRLHLENLLKETLTSYVVGINDEMVAKIDRKFREVILAEFEPRIEQAARKLLDDRLQKLRQEFAK